MIEGRAAARLTCPNCSSVYNLKVKPPKVDNKCDKCQSDLKRRPDDAPEVVKERLNVYRVQTAPLIEYYGKKNVLHNVNGENAPDVVNAEVMGILK